LVGIVARSIVGLSKYVDASKARWASKVVGSDSKETVSVYMDQAC
jgi:hypothetical protein